MFQDRELATGRFQNAETDRGAEGGNLGVDPPSAPPISFRILDTFGPTQTKSPEAS